MPYFARLAVPVVLVLAGTLSYLTLGAAAPAASPLAQAAPVAQAAPAAEIWKAEGTLLESCTCAVPCSCNFGEGPSPHDYCHAVFAYKLDRARWGSVDLSSLVFAGADGPEASIGFLDERATPAQRAALENLARAVFAQGGPAGGPRTFLSARITHQMSGNNLKLDIAQRGGFTARVITGRDGKTPVVVENNTIWPIRRAIKARALPLDYKDERGNAIHGDGSNANYGAFTFTGRVRPTTPAPPAPKSISKLSGGCCATDDTHG